MARAAPGDPDLVPGVSQSLAVGRSRRLSGLACDLTLDLTAGPAEPIHGHVVLRCTMPDAAVPLVIDFAPGLAAVSAVSANGRPSRPDQVNNHLVVPSEDLRAGDNVVSIAFRCGDGLHRAEALIYSLFVPAGAHRVFPCFDQPDLKARFELSLLLPSGWRAMSNAPEIERVAIPAGVRVRFAATPPLPTYVFGFAAGALSADTIDPRGRPISLFHRLDVAGAVARNRDAIVDLHRSAIAWLEAYTEIPYPFDKLDVLLVPSFEFRGMEHAGAIFYDADALLLDETATEDQILGRAQLIAHETAHMWFGNLVTMPWFDDVWLKEVFANLFAARIIAPLFPQVNHDLRFFVVHYPAAYAIERSAGSHPIRQRLDNLAHAKDLYGAIIYHKAPIVMRALEQAIGPDTLRDALRRHLRVHAFGCASWAELRADLEATPGVEGLESWSAQWIESPGRPVTRLAAPDHEGAAPSIADALAAGGRPAYTRWALDEGARRCLLDNLPTFADPLARATGWLALWDEMLDGRLPATRFIGAVVDALPREPVEQIVHLVLGCLREAFWRFLPAERRTAHADSTERALLAGARNGSTLSFRSTCFAAFRSVVTTPGGVERLERIWRRQERLGDLAFSEAQEATLAAELALRNVPSCHSLLDEQRGRFTSEDARARFTFVMPALSPAAAERHAWFEGLADPSRRRRQPWVLEGVGYVHHPLRAPGAEHLLPLALDLLEPIRETSDIFFARGWMAAALSGHRSETATRVVTRFLEDRPGYPAPLRRIVLQAADNLFRAAQPAQSAKIRAHDRA